MESEKAIREAFEKLVSTRPYDGITVADICRESYVSRKTFYHYYKDKDDLFRQIVEHDFMQPVMDLRRLLDIDNLKSATTLMTERAQELIAQKRDFYRNVFTTKDHRLMDIYIDMMTQLNCEIYRKTGLPEEKAAFAARMIAVSSAYADADWLASGCARTPAEERRAFG